MIVVGKVIMMKDEIPKNLTENELRDFYYIRACIFLNEKPEGYFEGDAIICAEILRKGGSIIDMYRSGVDLMYAACLSNGDLDKDVQQEIINSHIPF